LADLLLVAEADLGIDPDYMGEMVDNPGNKKNVY
jgi:hypothetical protein